MKQWIVGGLLVIGGVIISPFGPWVLGWIKTLSLMVFSATLSARSYWALWTHGGSNAFLWFFLGTLWAIMLVYAVIAMIAALVLAVNAVKVFALDRTRNTRVGLGEIFSNLCYSFLALFIYDILLYFASLIDASVGSWTTKPSIFAEGTYKSLFYLGVKGYLFVYSVSMMVAGLYILMDTSRKLVRSIRHG